MTKSWMEAVLLVESMRVVVVVAAEEQRMVHMDHHNQCHPRLDCDSHHHTMPFPRMRSRSKDQVPQESSMTASPSSRTFLYLLAHTPP